MCDECRQTVCPAQCPNYESIVSERCAGCGCDIYEYEDYFEVGGAPLCCDCFDAYKDKCRRIGGHNDGEV